MKSITVICKVTNGCNLNCPYCYNKNKLHNYEKMSHKTFEKIIYNICIEYQSAEIIFHGGEPTLLGKEWYEEAFKIIDRYTMVTNTQIKYSMQTNFVKNDDELYSYLLKENCGIGFSYDGTTNDLTRNKTKEVLSNFSKFKDQSELSCICLVGKNNYKDFRKELSHFEEIGIANVKLNPIYETVTMEGDLQATPSDLVKAMIDIYDEVCKSETQTPFDYNFNKYIDYTYGLKKSSTCENMNCLNKWVAVQPNGDLQPCGQEWNQNNDYTFGNIYNLTFNKLYESDKYSTFKSLVEAKMERCKSECPLYKVCMGGCPAKTVARTGALDGHDEFYCEYFKGILKGISNYNKENYENIKNPNVRDWINQCVQEVTQ